MNSVRVNTEQFQSSLFSVVKLSLTCRFFLVPFFKSLLLSNWIKTKLQLRINVCSFTQIVLVYNLMNENKNVSNSENINQSMRWYNSISRTHSTKNTVIMCRNVIYAITVQFKSISFSLVPEIYGIQYVLGWIDCMESIHKSWMVGSWYFLINFYSVRWTNHNIIVSSCRLHYWKCF